MSVASDFLSTIYIAGVARSGTSWVGQVFNSSPEVCFRFQPFFSYEFKGRLTENSSSEEFAQVFLELRDADTPFLTQADKVADGRYPQFVKSRRPATLVFKENRYQSLVAQAVRKVADLGLLAVVRNPCAVLNSWRKSSKEFPAGSDFLQEWRHASCKNEGPEDCFGYYRWKAAAYQYLDLKAQYPERVYILRYEDAVANPVEIFEEIFRFFGVPFGAASRQFLRDSTTNHSDNYYSVFKNGEVANAWTNQLQKSVIDEIREDVRHTPLERFCAVNKA